LLPHRLLVCCRSLLHSGDDSLIGSAAADVSLHSLQNLWFAGMRVPVQQCNRTHNHAWRAVSALKCFFIQKSLLDGMEPASALEAFDCCDVFPGCRAYRSAARSDWLAVEKYGACPALSFATTVLRAGEVETVTQNRQQRLLSGNIKLVTGSVYDEIDRHKMSASVRRRLLKTSAEK
jgi:hypothetical protein